MILAPLLAAGVIGCGSAFGAPSGWPGNAPSTAKVGPLWFTAVRSYATGLPPAQPDGWFFAKTPTALQAGHTAVVKIDRRDLGWARLSYGTLDRVGALTFSSCARSVTSHWTGWAGGFVVRRAGCVHFTVAIDGAPARKVKIALGEACA
ncbi:MAG: hypothetical protein QOH95_249 [Gaiellaceae bacterium]|jgi:hypothetical protein|nr:hypothetical protein [Gaiellaceae bacterium]